MDLISRFESLLTGGDTQGRRTRYGKVWRPPYLDFLTSTPRSSICLSPSSHRTSVSNVLSRGRGCRKKKYSIGPNEPLFAELGRPMAGSFLVNGPAAGSLCPHRVPPRVHLTDRSPVTAGLRFRFTGPVAPVTGRNRSNSNLNSKNSVQPVRTGIPTG